MTHPPKVAFFDNRSFEDLVPRRLGHGTQPMAQPADGFKAGFAAVIDKNGLDGEGR